MRSNKQKLLTFLLKVGAVLLAIQFALSIAYYLYNNTLSAEGALQIYGDKTPIQDATTPLYIGWIERFRGFREDITISARINGSSVAVIAPNHNNPMAFFEVEVGSAPVELEIEADVPGFPTRFAEITLTPNEETSWFHDPTHYQGRGSIRRPDLSPTDIDQPRVYLRDHEEEEEEENTCPWTFSVTPETGIAARNVQNRMWVQLSDADGTPLSNISIDISPPPEGGPPPSRDRLRTNSLGLASFLITPLSTETWTFEYSCNEQTISQELVIVPSWDGILLLGRSSNTSEASISVDVQQQRNFGTWFLDLICDGAWIQSHVYEKHAGNTTISITNIPLREEIGLCVLQASTSRLQNDPPRSSRNILVHDPSISTREAVLSLLSAWTQYSDNENVTTIGPGMRTALTNASEREINDFARWLLSQIPQNFQPLPQIYDDRLIITETFDKERAKTRKTLVVIMLIDGFVLLLTILLILIPASIAQRKRFAKLAEEDEEYDENSENSENSEIEDRFKDGFFDKYRDIIAIIVIVGLLTTFALGVATLIYYLQ